MPERKAAAERSKRRGSENRQRQHGVSVRFSPGELDMLDEACRRMGESRAHLLRNGALPAMDLFKALKKAKAIIEDRDRQLAAARTEERERIREVLTSDHAATVAGWAVEAELMSGVPYDEHVLSDEAVARAALGAAVKLLEENR